MIWYERKDIINEIVLLKKTFTIHNDKKKQLGIYYTPDFIVDYIVHKTINFRLIGILKKQGFLPHICSLDEVFVTDNNDILRTLIEKILPSLTICDMALGQGAFLIGCFRYLYHLTSKCVERLGDQYVKELVISNKKISDIKNSIVYNILKNNLYGIDLCEESVQIARLLLFKESFKLTSLNKLFFPDVNLLSGNSLIDFNLEKIKTGDWLEATNITDWCFHLSNVLEKRGFDIIVGNPPYINVKKIPKEKRFLYKSKYKTYNANGDVSNIFWELGITLLRDEGLLGYITPRYWIEGVGSEGLRLYLLKNTQIHELIDFRSNRTIFNPTGKLLGIDTMIGIVQKCNPSPSSTIKAYIMESNNRFSKLDKSDFKCFNINQSDLTEKKWILDKPNLICKINRYAKYKLGDDKKNKSFKGICYIGKGCSTGNNRIFKLKKITENKYVGKNQIELLLSREEKLVLKELIKNSDITHYFYYETPYYWIFLKDKDINNYPRIKGYLLRFKERLDQTMNKYNCNHYYDYAAYRSLNLIFSKTKIIVPYQAKRNKFALLLDKQDTIYETDVITLVIKEKYLNEITWEYLTCILNSALIHYYVKFMNKKIFNLYDFRTNQIASIPVVLYQEQDIFEKLFKILSNRSLSNISRENKKIKKFIDEVDLFVNCLIFGIYLYPDPDNKFCDYIKPRDLNFLVEGINEKEYKKTIFEWKNFYNKSKIQQFLSNILNNEEVKEIIDNSYLAQNFEILSFLH